MTMNDPFPRIFPLGSNAVCIEFGDTISERTNDLANALTDDLERNSFAGFIESVPAYASVTVFYDVIETSRSVRGGSGVFESVANHLRTRISALAPADARSIVEIEIPVNFGGSDGPDLDFIADRAGLSVEETIGIFTSRVYRVYMLGFLPGFPYLASVDARLAAPRKDTPRTKVARGSVGIAGFQTGIYPVDSPGGWQIIGRAEIPVFDGGQVPPSLLSPGDRVRFVAALKDDD